MIEQNLDMSSFDFYYRLQPLLLATNDGFNSIFKFFKKFCSEISWIYIHGYD